MEKMTIYQAGPLFTDAERLWHKTAQAELESADFKVIWHGELLTSEQIESAGPTAPALIYTSCKNALDQCDCVVALLDGAQVDDGTAWEIGYAHAKKIPIYGIRTDSRPAGDTQFNRVNGMIEGCLSGLARTIPEVIAMLRKS